MECEARKRCCQAVLPEEIWLESVAVVSDSGSMCRQLLRPLSFDGLASHLSATEVAPCGINREQMKEAQDIHWWSSPRRLLREILMLDDSAHSIALGTTIGMFIGMTPTVGCQMALVILLHGLIGRYMSFNRVAALITVYVTNPLTTVPIYYFNYKVGTLFVEGSVSYAEFEQILHYDSFATWWTSVVQLFVNGGFPLLIGSLIVGVICSAVTYPTMRWLLKSVSSTQVAVETTRPKFANAEAEKSAEPKMTVEQTS